MESDQRSFSTLWLTSGVNDSAHLGGPLVLSWPLISPRPELTPPTVCSHSSKRHATPRVHPAPAASSVCHGPPPPCPTQTICGGHHPAPPRLPTQCMCPPSPRSHARPFLAALSLPHLIFLKDPQGRVCPGAANQAHLGLAPLLCCAPPRTSSHSPCRRFSGSLTAAPAASVTPVHSTQLSSTLERNWGSRGSTLCLSKDRVLMGTGNLPSTWLQDPECGANVLAGTAARG